MEKWLHETGMTNPFFRGCRRKAAIGLLALTCVVTGWWVRSVTTLDLIVLPGRTTNFFIISGGQAIGYMSAGQRRITYGQIMTGEAPGRKITVTAGEPFVSLFGKPIAWETYRATYVSVRHHDVVGPLSDPPPQKGMISYWMIVIPMMALSTLLLLYTPRKFSRNNESEARFAHNGE